jgi:hypothetical protein
MTEVRPRLSDTRRPERLQRRASTADRRHGGISRTRLLLFLSDARLRPGGGAAGSQEGERMAKIEEAEVLIEGFDGAEPVASRAV